MGFFLPDINSQLGQRSATIRRQAFPARLVDRWPRAIGHHHFQSALPRRDGRRQSRGAPANHKNIGCSIHEKTSPFERVEDIRRAPADVEFLVLKDWTAGFPSPLFVYWMQPAASGMTLLMRTFPQWCGGLSQCGVILNAAVFQAE
jgi:hypothetical protein